LTRFLTIKSWERFQHYKDRDPPWVKLYRDTLTAESWVLGTDTSRLVQVASMLLAARYNNQIPYRWDLIKKVSHLDCTESQFNAAIKHLTDSDFLSIQSLPISEDEVAQSASTLLATCPSEERRGEKSREETEESQSARAKRLPDDWGLTKERRAIAESERIDPDRTFAKFTDYWRAASGQNARKRDWDAAWRNWCRTEADRKPSGGNGQHAKPIVRKTADEMEAEEIARGIAEGRTDEEIARDYRGAVSIDRIRGIRAAVTNAQH
jgi:hypothetical protein